MKDILLNHFSFLSAYVSILYTCVKGKLKFKDSFNIWQSKSIIKETKGIIPLNWSLNKSNLNAFNGIEKVNCNVLN